MNILLADDEPVLLQYMQTLIKKVMPEGIVVALCHDGDEVIERLAEMSPDVAFLDIKMPGKQGLELVPYFSENTQIVFVTAYDEHALAAFEQGAVDYLLKPVNEERLVKCLTRVKAKWMLLKQHEDEERHITEPYMRWVKASTGHSIQLIDVNEILYFKSDTKYTRVRTPEIEAYIRTPIKSLTQQLDPDVFWQVHRSAIINVKRIKKVVRNLDSTMHICFAEHDETIPVSQSYTHLFRAM